MYGYIYKTTNTINNKSYIGKHKAETFDKSYYGSGKILEQAIKKDGVNNFIVEVLEWCETLEELNEKEKLYIKIFDAQKSDKFYNIARGGDGGCVWGDKENHPNFGNGHRLAGKRNPFYGKHHSEETKRKIREANTGRSCVNKGKVKITKGTEIQYCDKDNLQEYINDGWTCNKRVPKGRTGWHQSEHQKNTASITHKGKIISDEQINKFKQSISKRSDEKRRIISEHCRNGQKNLCWVVDKNNTPVRIHKSEIGTYIANGYIRGRKFKK